MSWQAALEYGLFALSVASMTAGLVFVLAGASGVMRLPDFYTRMHSAGVTDTLGAELVVFGLMLQAHDWQTVAKLALVGLLLFMTSPTATHAIANAAHRAGLQPKLSRFRPAHPRETGQMARQAAPSPETAALKKATEPDKARDVKERAQKGKPGKGGEA